MAGYNYFKRGNWGWNPYKRYRSGSSVTSRAYGNYKAAKQQKDTMEFTINSSYPIAAAYDPAGGYGVAAVNVWEVLINNKNFCNFILAFDQVRIDQVRVKLNISNGPPFTGNNLMDSTNNLSVYTAWDRTGLSVQQVEFYKGAGNSNVLIPAGDYDVSAVSGFKNIIGKGIVDTSSATRSIYNPYRVWSRNMKLDLSGGQEKCDFINTAQLYRFCNRSTKTNEINMVTDRYNVCTVNELMSDGNPVIPFESPSCKFKPTLLLGVFKNVYDPTTGAITEFGQCSPVVFQTEWSVVCTFKAMKSGTNN